MVPLLLLLWYSAKSSITQKELMASSTSGVTYPSSPPSVLARLPARLTGAVILTPEIARIVGFWGVVCPGW